MDPIKNHDGFKSRKFLSTVIGTGIIELAAIVGWLVLDKMTAQEFIAINQWVWPLALAIFSASNVAEKRITGNSPVAK